MIGCFIRVGTIYDDLYIQWPLWRMQWAESDMRSTHASPLITYLLGALARRPPSDCCTMKVFKINFWIAVAVTLTLTLSLTKAEESIKFLGVGYNLLTGNPDGGLLSRGGIDPGLLYTRKILDLSQPYAVQSESRQSCAQTRQTSVFYGGKSYQNKLKRGVSVGGGKLFKRP
ncbi:hypothetical protein RRG08_026588 [Elysia crispata]|uniref:Uncharacterized protein n=1 Tax=Elysia crispata TaxID=231223 RepID=A0AAE1CSS5_9GAST|nr:hypothetical protein RRG08_026588 [Elysia crispata]